MANTLSGAVSQSYNEGISAILKPFGKIVYWITIIALIFIIVASLYVIGRFGINYYHLGGAQVGAKQAEVGAEQVLDPFGRFINRFSPEAAALWEGKTPVDTFSAEVDANEQNRNLGVRITEFYPTKEFFPEGEVIKLTGNIEASTLAEETKIEAFCSMEGYKNGRPLPAQLLGNTAQGNKGTVFKDELEEFEAICLFPPDSSLKLERQRTAKRASLIITYEFATKASQKLWFLNKESLLSLKGRDPFEYYKISDSQLDSKRRTRSKYTDGPLVLATNIDLPQPLAENTPYQLSIQLANNMGWKGNLEKLEYLSVEFPEAKDLSVTMEGEKGFVLADSKCDFEYTTTSEGFKIYELRNENLAEVNKECNKATLATLAISEKECVDLFKNPTFSCLIKAERVPENLEFAEIRATAGYLYKVQEDSVVEIRKPVEVA